MDTQHTELPVPLQEIEGMLLELPSEKPAPTEMRMKLVISPQGVTLIAWADAPEKSRLVLQQLGMKNDQIHEICLAGCCGEQTEEVKR